MIDDKKKIMLFPISESVRKKYEAIKTATHVFLVGLTGGIASGKTTVAQFLEDLGSVIIDFDILARNVVKPGGKAWQDVVDFFGQGVLFENGELNRKKMSEIVFSEPEKRRALEGFIHPAIADEFVGEVERAASEDNRAIIQVVVPLLIEGRMQELFDTTVVVYTPRERQVQRLMERDGISRERAVGILDAQMPIDEKVGYADFVIDNQGSIDETKTQVQNLWHKLKEQQKDVIKKTRKAF